jgi:Tfp pilus assembly protein PilN
MRAVNLLPRDDVVRSFEAKRGVAFGAAGGAAFVSVLLAAAIISAGGSASEQQAQLDSLNAELAALPKPAADTGAGDETLAADKSARIAALSTALGGRVAWDRVLGQISQVLPKDVWLTTLGITTAEPAAGAPAPEPTGAVTSSGITLSGLTYSQDGVARVLARLSVAPVLTNVQLVSSTAQPVGNRNIAKFTITADLRPAGSAS